MTTYSSNLPLTQHRSRLTHIGPRMQQACRYLSSEPDATMMGKSRLARWVGPNGSNRYGDDIVWRAIRAGLIAYRTDERGVYTLTLTAAGAAVARGEW